MSPGRLFSRDSAEQLIGQMAGVVVGGSSVRPRPSDPPVGTSPVSWSGASAQDPAAHVDNPGRAHELCSARLANEVVVFQLLDEAASAS